MFVVPCVSKSAMHAGLSLHSTLERAVCGIPGGRYSYFEPFARTSLSAVLLGENIGHERAAKRKPRSCVSWRLFFHFSAARHGRAPRARSVACNHPVVLLFACWLSSEYRSASLEESSITVKPPSCCSYCESERVAGFMVERGLA